MEPYAPILAPFDGIDRLPVASLCYGTILPLYKTGDQEDGPWSFEGIASDESPDVDGDEILRKSLDLSYAQKRGYVNWDHSREPEHQLGVLKKAQVIQGDDIKRLGDKLQMTLPATASVYMAGDLYRHVPKAVEVQKILKSTPPGAQGLGLSLDGVVARDVENGNVVKAFVRGVAMTPIPAHPHTLAVLKKSLKDAIQPLLLQTDTELIIRGDIKQVVGELKKALERNEPERQLTMEEAVLWVLKKKPRLSYELAEKVVQYTIQKKEKEGVTP